MRYLITGPSGSGKSTKARELSESTGLPIVKLDEHPIWKQFVAVRQSEFNELNQKLYHDYCSKLLSTVFTEHPDNCIIEGMQLLRMYYVPSDCRVILMMPPREQVVRWRVDRSVRKEIDKGRVVSKEFIRKKTDLAEKLWELTKGDMERIKALIEKKETISSGSVLLAP